MNKIHGAVYGSENLPVFAEADVAICGGGPGGLGAALMSAESGASTLVLESYGLPGGMAAISLLVNLITGLRNHVRQQREKKEKKEI